MGFFDRLFNVINGFFSSFIGNVEKNNPEVVYEAAIQERLKKQKELKEAVSGIVFLRNKTEKELDTKREQYAEIEMQLDIAMDEGDEEVQLYLAEQMDLLEPEISKLEKQLENCKAQAEDAIEALNNFRTDIKKLKREKEEMLAKAKTAEARIKIQEQLDGLSVDADTQALENVREAILKKEAQADIGKELADNSIDAKLAKIKAKTGSAKARQRLAALKKKRAQAAGGGPSPSAPTGGGSSGGGINFNKKTM
ncbi:MAG: PspA/IM30 family protein [Myxococcota bacterium]|nr:PspA/IM30 family protein [Myxococcota bacterium]